MTRAAPTVAPRTYLRNVYLTRDFSCFFREKYMFAGYSARNNSQNEMPSTTGSESCPFRNLRARIESARATTKDGIIVLIHGLTGERPFVSWEEASDARRRWLA